MDFRDLADADCEQYAELQTEHYLGHFVTTAEDLRRGGFAGRYVVVERGRVVAGARVSPDGSGPEFRRVEIFTGSDEAWRVLHDEVVRLVGPDGVTRLISVVREDFPACRRLESAGYGLGWQSWAAHILLDGPLADHVYAGLIADGRAAGREVVEVGVEHCEAAFRLYSAVLPDFPTTPATTPERHTLESFAKLLDVGRAFAILEDGACLALTVSAVQGDDAETDFTVVAGTHRRQGLAKLVKAVSIRTLASEGVRTFGTGGAAANAASLSMNQSLGYVLDPLWCTYVLEIQ